jgi:hypothetical protein
MRSGNNGLLRNIKREATPEAFAERVICIQRTRVTEAR